MFEKYDELNASVQENVKSIRVVKAFVREDHEIGKFNRAATNLYRLFDGMFRKNISGIINDMVDEIKKITQL